MRRPAPADLAARAGSGGRPDLAARAGVRRRGALVAALALGLVGGVVAPTAAAAQEPGRRTGPGGGWNSPRVLELVDRARARRHQPVADSTLRNYRAHVTGHIYFYVDREQAAAEPVLLRADQVALDLYWAQPDRVKQVIQGMRSEEQFPIKNFAYYLDRYTVIQNGFDDEIRVGEGRDVRNVMHPLAPHANQVYDYRLADSLTIRLPGRETPLRVYEIQVRPESFDYAAIVGSLFVERTHGDLVRLAFTFTPSAYLDPRNERVEIMLENALWEGKYWLPREQRLLVRREIPELDLDVGTVIRAALKVTDYQLNVELPQGFFLGSPVVAAGGPEALARYPFETGLYQGFQDVGIAPGEEPGTLDAVDVDAIAGRIIRERYFRGLSRVRLYAPVASDLVRYDRAEGWATGAGVAIGFGRSQLYGYGGYAWGGEYPLAEAGWGAAGPTVGRRLFVRTYLNRPVGAGLRPAAAGVVSTLSAAAIGQDFRDVHRATGATIGIRAGAAPTGRLAIAAHAEEERPPVQAARSAPFDDGAAFRPVLPAVRGHRYFLSVDYARRKELGPVAVTVEPGVEVGYGDFEAGTADLAAPAGAWDLSGWPERRGAFGRARVDLSAEWTRADQNAGVRLGLTAAAAVGAVRVQDLWYVGGRNTLPGHPFHGYLGDRAAVLTATGWRTLVPRLLRLRLLAGAAWTALDPDAPRFVGGAALDDWTPTATDGVEASVGMGIGLIDGLVRLDYGVRTDTGAGSLIFSIDPRLWSFL